jgi:prepilin-type N-terminal cleavage/methylation domain-containing protein
MVTTGSGRGRGQRGFSLAEVIVALGILASVLVSVAGLLVVGNRMVKAGRGSSLALAVARDILEECDGRSFAGTYEVFGCDATQSSCTVDTASPVDPSMAQWKQMVEEGLYEGFAEVRIESAEDGDVPLQDSRALRVTVSVFWTEGPRARNTRLTTVRM